MLEGGYCFRPPRDSEGLGDSLNDPQLELQTGTLGCGGRSVCAFPIDPFGVPALCNHVAGKPMVLSPGLDVDFG